MVKCLESIIYDHGEKDPRMYMTINICNHPFEALLDSGASVSVLGSGSLEFLKENNIKYQKMFSFVETADGNNNKVEGYVKLPIKIGQTIETILFCIVPILKGKIYLGIDFFKKFNLIPRFKIGEISVPKLSDSLDKKHVLSDEEASQLESVIKLVIFSFICSARFRSYSFTST